MPRQSRIAAPGALNHVIIRGINRERIFYDHQDRLNFLKRLGDLTKKSKTGCYAWALLDNHAHLLLRKGSFPIATLMRRLLTGYVVNFNRRHNRWGHRPGVQKAKDRSESAAIRKPFWGGVQAASVTCDQAGK